MDAVLDRLDETALNSSLERVCEYTDFEINEECTRPADVLVVWSRCTCGEVCGRYAYCLECYTVLVRDGGCNNCGDDAVPISVMSLR